VTLPAPQLTDETLAARAQQGDHQAFDALIGRHKEFLYRLVRRYLGNSDDAYDLLQETFIAAWENLQRYDPQRSFVAWARTIALNKCRDFSRRRQFRRWVKQLVAVEPSLEPASPESETEMAEAKFEQDDRLHRLDDAIAMLPALYKEPLLLATLGGLSQQATAAALKTTPKAIEMRLRRARQQLASLLDPARESHAGSLPSKKKRFTR
jgi:RNA polymerase sigma-70 factor (ECF subfamily)